MLHPGGGVWLNNACRPRLVWELCVGERFKPNARLSRVIATSAKALAERRKCVDPGQADHRKCTNRNMKARMK